MGKISKKKLFRKEFSLTRNNYINFDNAATTPPFKSVEEALNKDLLKYGSVHRGSSYKSQISTENYEHVRKIVREYVHATDDYYTVFVPNTTSGINQIAYIFSQITGKILFSDIEHSSSMLPWIFHEGRRNTSKQVSLRDALANNTDPFNKEIVDLGKQQVVTFKTNSDFSYNLVDIARIFEERNNKIDKETIKLICIVGASNITGYKPPIKELSTIAHNYGALVMVDACQLIQHDQIDMVDQGIDFLVFSGHKMYAPYGSGAIVGIKKLFDAFWPYQMGGGNFPYISADGIVCRNKNERAHDPGTPNYVGARAIEYSIQQLKELGIENLKNHNKYLFTKAIKTLSSINQVILYNSYWNDSSVIAFNVSKFPHYLVSQVLNDLYSIGTRAGSFCVYEYTRRINGIQEDEDILQLVQAGDISKIPGCIRVSFGLMNTEQEISRLAFALKEIIDNGPEYYLKLYMQIHNSAEYTIKN